VVAVLVTLKPDSTLNVEITKICVNWSVIIRLDFLASAILFDENNELMTIVNGNA